jgi:hypothetical protein
VSAERSILISKLGRMLHDAGLWPKYPQWADPAQDVAGRLLDVIDREGYRLAPVVEHDPAHLHALGLALAQLEAAIGETPEAFRTGADHAHIVGDAFVFAAAMRGFVITHDPEAAALIAAEYERSPEQGARLS